jgi:hypothetical protein
MPEHTPGPWRSDDDNPLLILDGKGVAIAELVKPEIGSLSFSLYNRRVVIAAPELLAALRSIESGLPAGSTLIDGANPFWRDAYKDLQRIARAAIAKATGGAQ